MAFYADLHIHSKYSRATSRDGDLEHMALWARKKGVAVVGTGDFTHPGWRREIEEKLVAAEPGLFRLRPDLEAEVDRRLGASGPPTRFLLEVEISTIYKKGERTRKVHHLVYVPDLERARRVIARLERIGNLASDGRPILGLDSRDLLEITLEAGEGSFLIPAHIWTPWFAALGSKSGFDSIEECYGDLASEIFAVETGLSSDPAMNRRLSALDRFTLVSNSDAHSPPKIGREACAFDTELDYYAMLEALRTGRGYAGTVEFFAEEGKYHLDGHRKCGVCLTPEETRRNGGVCPVCGRALTLGVMHRVSELADRGVEQERPLAGAVESFIPLEEVLAEIDDVGPKTKTVQRKYEQLIARGGPELYLLGAAPVEELERAGSPLVAEAVARMRAGRVIRKPGFDGEYGTIRLFEPGEIEQRVAVALQTELFELPPVVTTTTTAAAAAADTTTAAPGVATRVSGPLEPAAGARAPTPPPPPAGSPRGSALLARLDEDQRAAARLSEGPVAIIAGPGTGKTRTLTHRIAYLIEERGADPGQCLAITFTRRAATGMVERLTDLLPGRGAAVPVLTFHAFGAAVLREHAMRLGFAAPPRIATVNEARTWLGERLRIPQRRAQRLLASFSRARRQGVAAPDPLALAAYEEELRRRGRVDFDDLIRLPLELLRAHADLAAEYRARYPWVSVDEYQDIDALQYELVRTLVPGAGNLCVIGDPDQAIYGFRGADAAHFARFAADFPGARVVHLRRNYRSSATIVAAALQVVAPSTLVPERRLEAQGGGGSAAIEVHTCASERAEAEQVVHAIERALGGSTFFSIDSGRVRGDEEGAHSLADFAILYRTEAQAGALVEALHRSGMPFQQRSHRALADIDGVADLLATVDALAAGDATRPVADLLESALAAAAPGPGAELQWYREPLRALARRAGADLPRFAADLALGVDVDLWDPRAEAVTLLTLHASKGLEFPVVFIVGCEEGLLPLTWGSGEEDRAEERRLLFVGMTRARSRLVLSLAQKRRGRKAGGGPSSFLADIDIRLLTRHDHSPRRRAGPRFEQLNLFAEG